MDRLEFEIEVSRERYKSEKARGDSVRSATAMPLAALSFAAFGFGIFAQSASFLGGRVGLWVYQSPDFWFASLALLAACLALSLFLLAIYWFRYFDYTGLVPYAEALDVEDQYQSLTEALVEGGIDRLRAQKIASISAWRAAQRSFEDSADAQHELNRGNLALQHKMLNFTLWGLGSLVSSIALSALAKLVVISSLYCVVVPKLC